MSEKETELPIHYTEQDSFRLTQNMRWKVNLNYLNSHGELEFQITFINTSLR